MKDGMKLLLHELRLFFIALQFLTRVPVPRWVGFEPAWLHASARHFPAVGACVGALAAAVLWAAAQAWPAAVAVGLSMLASVWLTGAFHEDGLADTADALGGAVSRERALEIMKDSRIGSYGAVALILVLGLKAAVLLALAQRELALVLLALPLAHGVSRVVPVCLLRLLPYAGDLDHAKAKPMAQQVSRASLWVALGWCALLGIAAAALGANSQALVTVMLATAAVVVLTARWLMRRLGGYTGDTLGAAQQGSELVILLALLAHTAHG
jgi:adenosylcobinamide-GDP ribazoletransferase